MGTIRLQNVTKQFGPQIVLADVDLELQTGETTAIIGANGVGKTTLFRLITGTFEPDIGTVTLSKGLEVGYLPQEPGLDDAGTLHDAVSSAFDELLALERKLHDVSHQLAAEHDGPRAAQLMQQYDRFSARFEAAGGYRFEQRLHEILGGLGFSRSDYELPVNALSGGQKCRAALAKLLLQERQFLLLDEPTNHLDIDAVRWLEKFLAGHHGGALIVSHDRYLLDRLAQRIIEVVATPAGGKVFSYPGNYSRFLEIRDNRELSARRQYEKDREYIAKEREFIEKNKYGQRYREARGRLKRLERRIAAGELLAEPPRQTERNIKLRFDQPQRRIQADKEVVRLSELGRTYGDKVLFTDLSLSLYAGQRLGITGPNGTGKTTLLRIILTAAQKTTRSDAAPDRVVQPTAGHLDLLPTAHFGYFAQEPTELDPTRTVIQEICAARPDFLERDARNYAARFLFTDEEPFKSVGNLSGGEQSRVRLMKLILSVPEILVLDEPTNHLDIPSREALEQALASFPGTIITVSHDRYFLDRIVDRLLVMRPGDTTLYNGNYSYYIEQSEQQKAATDAAARRPSRTKRGQPARSTTKSPPKRKTRYQKMKLVELEEFIANHEAQLSKLQERFGDADVYRNPDSLTELRAEFDTLKSELDQAEQAWLEKADKS